jgi:hypothetical protein
MRKGKARMEIVDFKYHDPFILSLPTCQQLPGTFVPARHKCYIENIL